MAKRLAKKSAPRLPRTAESFQNSCSTISLSSSGHRLRTYRWRYLQLIKDGLIWLTGKRTRAARASESKRSVNDSSEVSASRAKKQVQKILRFKDAPRKLKQPTRKRKNRKAQPKRKSGRSKARRVLVSKRKGSKKTYGLRSKGRAMKRKTRSSKPSVRGRPKKRQSGGRPKGRVSRSAPHRKQRSAVASKRTLTSRGPRSPRDARAKRTKVGRRSSSCIAVRGSTSVSPNSGPEPTFKSDGRKHNLTSDERKPYVVEFEATRPKPTTSDERKPMLASNEPKPTPTYEPRGSRSPPLDGPKQTMRPATSASTRSVTSSRSGRRQTTSGPKRRGVTQARPAVGAGGVVTRSVSRRDLRNRCQISSRHPQRVSTPILIK